MLLPNETILIIPAIDLTSETHYNHNFFCILKPSQQLLKYQKIW